MKESSLKPEPNTGERLNLTLKTFFESKSLEEFVFSSPGQFFELFKNFGNRSLEAFLIGLQIMIKEVNASNPGQIASLSNKIIFFTNQLKEWNRYVKAGEEKLSVKKEIVDDLLREIKKSQYQFDDRFKEAIENLVASLLSNDT